MATAGAVAVAQVVAAGVGVAGTAMSIQQSHESTKERRKQQEIQQRTADVEAQRRRALMLRQSRIQRARIQNVAAQTGTAGSSGEAGALSSLSSQTNANLSFLDTTRQLTQQAGAAGQRAADAAGRAQTAGAIGNLATQYGDFGAIIK